MADKGMGMIGCADIINWVDASLNGVISFISIAQLQHKVDSRAQR